MFKWLKKKPDPELQAIIKRMDEIKASNRAAVDELKDLNKTLRETRKQIEKELKALNRA